MILSASVKSKYVSYLVHKLDSTLGKFIEDIAFPAPALKKESHAEFELVILIDALIESSVTVADELDESNPIVE